MPELTIAVVGSGISGLSAAWLLAKRHRVVLYEADGRFGGHANTVDVSGPDGTHPVDTGFIVYNTRNYPNLIGLFDALGVETEPTEMSFALSLDGGRYEYAGAGLNGFFGQRRNLARPSHWQLLRDIARFFRTAEERVAAYPLSVTLGEFLEQEGFSTPFVRNHIVPMGAAIWSTTMTEMLAFPAQSFVRFYANHGMLQFRDRPAWRTVSGGSRNYVQKLLGDAPIERLAGTPAARIERKPDGVTVIDASGAARAFDHVVVAAHADQALALLDQPSPLEAKLLSCFSYQTNRAVLHRDRSWMPKRRRLWSSWNYLKSATGDDTDLCVTYWMNRLQNLSAADDYFVTLNPTSPIDPDLTERVIDYDHPVFNAEAMAAQAALPELQGAHRTWFCGSYFGYGFHEDGAASGIAVAERLGGLERPWTVDGNERLVAVAPLEAEAAQ